MRPDDLRHALRRLRRSPRRASLIVLILALGIGLDAGLFSVVHSLRTRPAPGISTDDRLVRVRGLAVDAAGADVLGRPLGRKEVEVLAAREDIFARVASWRSRDALFGGSAEADPLAGAVSFVSDGWFDLLGVRTVLGRPPTGGGDVAPGALISHDLWTSLFGAAPDVVGRSLRVDGVEVAVTGVATPGFRGPDRDDPSRAAWIPREGADVFEAGGSPEDEGALSVAARLAPGTTLARATEVARALAGGAPDDGRDRSRELTADVVPMLAWNATPAAGTDVALGAVSGLALLVLLIVGTNVSVLLVGEGVARRREIAVRLSIGASRLRIVGQLVTESVVLSLAGAALGLAVLKGGVAAAQAELVRETVVVDGPTVAVVVLVAALTGVLAGVSPALHATRSTLSDALAGAGSSPGPARLRLQRRLVALQVAVTQPLLLGVVALVAFLGDGAPSGATWAHADRVLVVETSRVGSTARYERLQAEMDRLIERVEALPAVDAVASQPGGFRTAEYAADDGGPRHRVRELSAAPGWFGLVGAPLLRGRDFEPEEEGVAIVSASLARRLWDGADPVGRMLVRRTGDGQESVRVVGVAAAAAVPAGPGEALWVSVGGGGREVGVFHDLYVRTRGSAAALAPEVTALARREAPSLSVKEIRTLEARLVDARRDRISTAAAAAAGGLLALLLASVGLYASVGLAVRQRQREIGVRMALGARARRVQLLFVRGGLEMALVGLVVGLPLSVLASRWLLGELSMSGSLLGAAVSAAVLGVTLLASWIPARRASHVDPMATLRPE